MQTTNNNLNNIIMVPQHKSRQPTYTAGRYAQTISRSSNLHLMQQQQLHQQQQFQHYQQTIHPTRNPIGYVDFHPNYNALIPPLSSRDTRGLTLGALPRKHNNDSLMANIETQALLNKPLCRCRVMYLGSSVPHYTKNGLHGIQEPLKHLYPEEQFSAGKLGGTLTTSARTTIDISHLSSGLGIDSWLSVWSNGLLLQNVDEFGQEIKRFFSIDSLHYCAAVRFFDTTTLVSSNGQFNTTNETPQFGNKQTDTNNNNQPDLSSTAVDKSSSNQEQEQQQLARKQRKSVVRFLPLDAPLFQCPGMMDPNHPPVFAAIMRRTTGIKVLECHAFICRRDAAANALVRCCTHAYADFLSAKRLSMELGISLGRNEYGGRVVTSSRSGIKNRPSLVENNGERQQQMSSFGQCSRMDTNNSGSKESTVFTLNEENSLEVSSEDNYAIITKHPQPNGKADSNLHNIQLAPEEEVALSRDEANLTNDKRTTKGSSKSLFNDFKPKNTSLNRQELDSGLLEVEKLSHSLDILEVNETGELGDNTSQYSASNKRHSRSMQNLDGPFEFSASEARSSARRNQRRQSRRSRDYDYGSYERSKKANSYQDMRKTSCRLAKDDEEGSSQARYLDTSLDMRSCCGNQKEIVRGSRSHDKSGCIVRDEVQRVARRSRRSRSSQQQQQPVLPAPNCRLPDCNLVHQQQPVHYYEPMPLKQQQASQQSSSGHYYQPVLYAPAGQATSAMYHHYAPACYPILPHYAAPSIAQFGSHPNGNLYAAHDPYLTAYAPTTTTTTTPSCLGQTTNGAIATTRRNQTTGSTKAASLTTRFRCLSPPINILIGKSSGKRSKGGNSNGTHRVSSQDEERRQEAIRSEETINGRLAINQQVAGDEEQQVGSGCELLEQVVSGEPSFMSSANTLRRKKMSWIKRLSLTMASGSGSPVASGLEENGTPTDGATSASAFPSVSGGAKQERATTKRRSGLFSGTLTLGRRQQQRSKLVED